MGLSLKKIRSIRNLTRYNAEVVVDDVFLHQQRSINDLEFLDVYCLVLGGMYRILKDINATPSETNPYRASREEVYLTVAGIRTRDLRFTSLTLYQLRYKAKPGASRETTVFVFDILKLTSFLHSSTDYVCNVSKVK